MAGWRIRIGSEEEFTGTAARPQTSGGATLGTAAYPWSAVYAQAFAPPSNDGAALGSASASFADLFLASGGVINWANGDATITHSTGVLTLNTGIGTFGWSDIKIQRAGANRALFTSGATDYFDINGGGSIVRSNLDFRAKSIRGDAVAFASLPTAVEGMLVAVTDSTTVVWGATITGGGANHVLAYYNGTNWTVAGK